MKKLSFFLLSLTLMAILCTCGGSTKESGTNQGNVVPGGSVVVGITNDMDSLDPHKAVAAGTSEVLYNIYEGLVKADADGKMQPAIAESYTVSDDAKTYTFTLKKDVHFHNGNVVTGEDVVYSVKRAAGLLGESDIHVVSAFSIISDITTTKDGDKEIVTVTLSEPNTELIYYFNSAVVPADYTELATKPCGTGPFKFVSYSPLASVEMEKNNDYYGTKAYLDKVSFKIYGSGDDAFMELLAGNVDIFPYLTYDQSVQLEGKYNIARGAQSLAEGMYLNNEDEVLKDVKVRQALCYAFDFDEYNELISGGSSSKLGSAMFKTFANYYDESNEKTYTHDIEKAKALLKEAGYENGLTIELTIPNNYELHITTAEILVSQLKKAGITVKVKQVDWSTWLSDVYMGHNYQATVIALDATMAPGDVLDYYLSTHSSNFINFHHEEYDKLYNKALSATSDTEKIENYKLCQKYITDNAASVYLMAPSIEVAVNKKLGGYTFYPIYVQDMASVYYTEK